MLTELETVNEGGGVLDGAGFECVLDGPEGGDAELEVELVWDALFEFEVGDGWPWVGDCAGDALELEDEVLDDVCAALEDELVELTPVELPLPLPPPSLPPGPGPRIKSRGAICWLSGALSRS